MSELHTENIKFLEFFYTLKDGQWSHMITVLTIFI
jgi:hypothetical protein